MKFPIEVLLTISTGRLYCDIGKVYEILNHMTGDNLFTHQLPRAMDACAKPLLAQHPFLNDIKPPEEFKSWLDDMKEKYPGEYEVGKIEGWQQKNPMAELAEMMVGN